MKNYTVACPCKHAVPCHPSCTCVNAFSSHGCARCCTYGNDQQRKDKAQQLIARLDQKPIHFEFHAVDSDKFMGAYGKGSLSDGKAIILFNMDAFLCLSALEKTSKERAENLQDSMLQIGMHEFGHAMQEFLGMAFTEENIDHILDQYKPEWRLTPEDVNDEFIISVTEYKEQLRMAFEAGDKRGREDAMDMFVKCDRTAPDFDRWYSQSNIKNKN